MNLQQVLDPSLGHGRYTTASEVCLGPYRYVLTRRWAAGPTVLFVMLNPSTATGDVDDPTVRRCVGFAAREGAGALDVCNLYALRSRDPRNVLCHPDPVGPLNDLALEMRSRYASTVVVAWGAGRAVLAVPGRVAAVVRLLGDRPLYCLGRAKGGAPRHPLMVSGDAPLQPYTR